MDELLELEPGNLKGPEKLEDLESWDSLAIVSFMGSVKAKVGQTLSPKNIAACRHVDDLFALVGDQAAG
jgi:acyl carrier protein